MPALNITGSYKYVDITPGHVLINGTILYVNTSFRVNDTDLTGAPGGDFGDYYIHLRPNRKIMEAYYSKNWEYVIYSTGPAGASPPVNPDEMAIGYIQKRQVSGNTTLTAVKLNRTERLIDTKDISDAAVTPAQLDRVYLTATDVSNKAPLADPVFTGDPRAPTPATADNDTSIATTAFVKAQSYLTTTLASSTYAPIASPTLTGTPASVTPATADNTTKIATTAYVKAQGYLTSVPATYAPLASPAFTGTPTAPTAAVDTNTTQLATTAYVVGQGYLKTVPTTYAPLDTPTFIGVPAAPTAAVDTNTTQLATTAYVVGQGYLKSATAASTYAPLASPTFTGTTTSAAENISGNLTLTGTTSQIIVQGTASATATVFSAKVQGDTQSRITLGVDGKLTIGTGAAVGDVNLYRGTANRLQSDDEFMAGGTLYPTNNTDAWIQRYTGINGIVLVPNLMATDKLWLNANSYRQSWRTGTNSLGGDQWEATYNDNASWAYIKCQSIIQVSDPALKTNVKPVTDDLLTKIRGLGIYRYNRTDLPADAPQAVRDKQYLGVMADDIATNFPELASYSSTGTPDGVDYSRLGVVALVGLKRMYVLLQNLQNKVDALTPPPPVP